MIKNQQAPEPRTRGDGSHLEVNSIFATIQGEGPFAGSAAVFVRLAGCNLQCPLCDTEYSRRSTQPLSNIALAVRDLAVGPLVVITGGEPFRQPITPLVRMLRKRGHWVQVETNGRLPIENPDYWAGRLGPTLQLVVSPKTSRLDPFIAANASAYKYVIHADKVRPEDGLPLTALDNDIAKGSFIARPPATWKRGHIYVQPCDEQDPATNARHMAAAVAAVRDFPDQRRRLCLQMHKYADLP